MTGNLIFADCSPDATSVDGQGHEYRNQSAALEIRFRSLPDGQRDFLCPRQSFSEWRGTVMLTDQQVPSRFSVDVLGTPMR